MPIFAELLDRVMTPVPVVPSPLHSSIMDLLGARIAHFACILDANLLLVVLRKSRFEARRGEIDKGAQLQWQQSAAGMDETDRPGRRLELSQRKREPAGSQRGRDLVRAHARHAD